MKHVRESDCHRGGPCCSRTTLPVVKGLRPPTTKSPKIAYACPDLCSLVGDALCASHLPRTNLAQKSTSGFTPHSHLILYGTSRSQSQRSKVRNFFALVIHFLIRHRKRRVLFSAFFTELPILTASHPPYYIMTAFEVNHPSSQPVNNKLEIKLTVCPPATISDTIADPTYDIGSCSSRSKAFRGLARD